MSNKEFDLKLDFEGIPIFRGEKLNLKEVKKTIDYSLEKIDSLDKINKVYIIAQIIQQLNKSNVSKDEIAARFEMPLSIIESLFKLELSDVEMPLEVKIMDSDGDLVDPTLPANLKHLGGEHQAVT